MRRRLFLLSPFAAIGIPASAAPPSTLSYGPTIPYVTGVVRSRLVWHCASPDATAALLDGSYTFSATPDRGLKWVR